jgi:Zn-dependent M28 family amino/carboxypeptidase
LAFREIPEEIPNPRRIFLNQVSRLHHKALVAKQAGAIGLLLVSGPNSTAKQKILKLRFDGSFAEAGIPVVSISDETAEALLKSTGRSLKSWQTELDKGAMKGESELKNVLATAQVELIEKKSTGHNTLGMIQVPGAKQTLVIGAHGDHLGRGESGSSLARGGEVGQVHFGADDNASGVAALFMIAQAMQTEMKKGTFKPKQNILFAVWSGEEIGLLGSSAFLKMNKAPLSAYLNMDMVGRLRETLMVQGAGSALEWRQILEPLAIAQKLSVSIQNDPYVPSDSMVFYVKQVPTVMFFTGVHTEYHTPRDTAATLNYEGISEIARLMSSTAQVLASGQDKAQKPVKLTYEKVESSHQKLEGRSFRVYLGTIPDYAQEKVKGVLISGTSKDSPAEKSGLKAGDVIKGLAGTKIDNIYDYVYVLQSLKPNQKIPVEVYRQGQSLTLELTPVLKE